jgi:hypothetical protein
MASPIRVMPPELMARGRGWVRCRDAAPVRAVMVTGDKSPVEKLSLETPFQLVGRLSAS